MLESNYVYSDDRGKASATPEEKERKEKLRQQKITLVDRFLVLNQNDLPDSKIPVLRQRMQHCSLQKLQAMQNMTIRRSYTMQFISIILGWSGIDRMLIGDVALGLVKLFTLGGCGFLMLWDWAVIVRRTRYYNYLQVMSVLDYNDYESSNG